MTQPGELWRLAWQHPHILVGFAILAAVLTPGALVWARWLGWGWWRSLVAAAAGGSAAAFLAVTLVRHVEDVSLGVRGCASGTAWESQDGVLNLFPLVPFGFLLTLALRRVGPAALWVGALPAAVELVQSLSGLGTCQGLDWVRNVLGGLVAVGCGWVLLRLFGGRSQNRCSSRPVSTS